MLAVVAVVVVGGVVAGVVIAGQDQSAPAVGAMQAAIETTAMTKVAEVAAQDGLTSHGVYVQELKTGYLCIWDIPSSATPSRQGSCNDTADPLGGSQVIANLAYDGGPAIETVRDARITGLAAAEVASVRVLMSDGSERVVSVKRAKLRSGDFLAFGYRIRSSDLKRGIGPIAIVVYDADRNEIGRQTTGIG